MRYEIKRFSNCVAHSGWLASSVNAAIRPKQLSDLNAALQKIRSGTVGYYVDDNIQPGSSSGARCQCVIDKIAIFFNEFPPGTLELVDAQYQP